MTAASTHDSRLIGSFAIFFLCLLTGPLWGMWTFVCSGQILRSVHWFSVFVFEHRIFERLPLQIVDDWNHCIYLPLTADKSVVFAYLLGGIQAALVGLVFSIFRHWKRRLPLWLAMICGVVTSIPWVIMVAFGHANAKTFVMWSYILLHVGAALGCWLTIHFVSLLWRLLIRRPECTR